MLVCPKCGYEAKKGAEFCRKCGAHLTKHVLCAKCGSRIKPDAQFCRKCGSKIKKISKPMSLSTILIGGLVLLIFLVFLAVGAVVVLLGGLQTPTDMTLDIEAAELSCGENLEYSIQITENDEGIAGKQMTTYVNDELYEKFRTDQNGRFSSSKKVPSEWCGKEIYFEVRYPGDITHAPASVNISIPVRIPTGIWLSIPTYAINNTQTTANVTLFNALDRKAIQGRGVTVTNGISESGFTDANGIASFVLIFTRAGVHDVKAVFEGDDTYLASETAAVEVEVIPEFCDDGTFVGYCSDINPGYVCNQERTLVANCTLCKCGSSLVCYNNTCMTEEERTAWLIYTLQNSMVYVEHSFATGSGVIIGHEDGKTVILTNRHVVEGADGVSDLRITTREQQTYTASDILIAPYDMDLAIVKIRGTYGNPATFGYDYWQGQGVVALGSPLGLQGSVSEGIISNHYYSYTDSNYQHVIIQTDAAINPGNSGGGLFLKSTGELIGINTFIYASEYGAEGLGFATFIEEFDKLRPYDDWDRFVPVSRCTDGTPYGMCSYNNPGHLCSNGRLVERCSLCGCPEDEYCLSDDTCFGCPLGYDGYEDRDGNGFCCLIGWSAWSDGNGEGYCCRPGWSAWMDEDGDGFCCPPGTSGYYDGTCG